MLPHDEPRKPYAKCKKPVTKDTHRTTLFLCNSQKEKLYGDRKIGGCLRLGGDWGENGESLLIDVGFPFG